MPSPNRRPTLVSLAAVALVGITVLRAQRSRDPAPAAELSQPVLAPAQPAAEGPSGVLRSARLALQREAARLVGLALDRDTSRTTAVLERSPLDTGEPRADAPLVILLHGFGDGPWRLRELQAFLAAQEPAVLAATYTFANDAPIDALGRELAAELEALAAADPRPVHLVGYSMGGLVARYAIETPALVHGKVRQLIQIGTPNQGTHLAYLSWVVDARRMVMDPSRDQIVATVRDGLNEAGWDLRPGSSLLRELNQQPRNPDVRYRVVLGSAGPLSGPDYERLRDRALGGVDKLGLPKSAASLVKGALTRTLGTATEAWAGRGDGIVSLQRGALEGVVPLIVPMSHREMMRAAPEQPVFAAVHRWVVE